MTSSAGRIAPLLALALALQNTRGGYAFLLGSGLSRPAGILLQRGLFGGSVHTLNSAVAKLDEILDYRGRD